MSEIIELLWMNTRLDAVDNRQCSPQEKHMLRCVGVCCLQYVDKRYRKTYSFVCVSHKKSVRRENVLYLHDIPTERG